MPEFTLQDSRVHYREWGNKKDSAILILHGWGVDSAQYEKLGSLLAKRGLHVIVPDLPGFGSTPAPAQSWGVWEYVEWVRELVSTLCHDDKVIIFGHSFGGRIAIKYAVKYPEQLRALILCAAAGIKPSLTLKRVTLYCVAKIGRMIFKPPGLNFTGEILKRILYRLAGVTDYLKARGIMKGVLAKTVKEDLKPLLQKIKTPTLILWGEEDRTTPIKDAHTITSFIAGAKLVIFKDARHNLPKQIPEKLAEEIIKYIH